MLSNLQALILAAGKGTRMKSELPKVVHPILGKPMVAYVIEAVKALGCNNPVLVTGFGSETVKDSLKGESVSFVEQPQQLGTGHAVQCYAEKVVERPEHLLVVCGDTPLISRETLSGMVALHESENPAITMMTLIMESPGNYGRILRNGKNEVCAIREAKDCDSEELQVKEVNLAVYLFEAGFLFENIFNLDAKNSQKEYYLTDLVEMAVKQGKKVLTCIEKDEASTLGINSRQHLAQISKIVQQQILQKHMDAGVTISSPDQTFIGPDVSIEPDTTIHPGVMLSGRTSIGRDCVIGPSCKIDNSSIGNNCKIEFATVNSAKIDSNSTIEPFSLVEG